MKSEEFRFNFLDTDFFGKSWEATETKAVVVLVHGLGEYVSRYERNVIPKLVENRFSVVGYDQFGHGKTKGKLGYSPSYDAVLECLNVVISKAKELYPEKQVFLYGHSMGGNVVVNYVLRKDITVRGVIASSPFLKLGFNPPAWKIKMGLFLEKIYPKITLDNSLDTSKISRIPDEVIQYEQDVQIHSKVSPNYSIKFIESGQWAIENANKLKVPMFLVHGTSDGIISVEGTKKFAKNSDLSQVKLYEGGYHELHNDLCREELLTDVITWLNSQI